MAAAKKSDFPTLSEERWDLSDNAYLLFRKEPEEDLYVTVCWGDGDLEVSLNLKELKALVEVVRLKKL